MESSVLKENRAKILRAARERAGLTQEEIAKRIKVAKQTYLKWENGDTEPKATQIKLLAQELKISADEICNGVLFEKYALDDFIMEQMISQAPSDIITLRTWQFIHDHQGYMNSLVVKDLERKKRDLQSAIETNKDLIEAAIEMTEEEKNLFTNAIKRSKEELAKLESK